MKSALTYLHTHRDQRVSLTELARRADMSPAHFCRSFTKAYGLSAHRYQAVLRITRAKSMLTAGVKISDAAVSAGFADQSYLFYGALKVKPLVICFPYVSYLL